MFLSTWHYDIMGSLNIFSEVHSLNIQNCALISHQLRFWFNNPNFQDLTLWNLPLYAVYRAFNPTTILQYTMSWDDTMICIAANTSLQSFWAGHLPDGDGQTLYTQPWVLKATPEHSVSRAISINYRA